MTERRTRSKYMCVYRLSPISFPCQIDEDMIYSTMMTKWQNIQRIFTFMNFKFYIETEKSQFGRCYLINEYIAILRKKWGCVLLKGN